MSAHWPVNDGEDRSERITGGRKGSLIPAYSPTKIPEFPFLRAACWTSTAIENVIELN